MPNNTEVKPTRTLQEVRERLAVGRFPVGPKF